jgi:hypothetical protein
LRAGVALDREQWMCLRLAVTAGHRHAVAVDGLAGRSRPLMGLQRRREHVDRGVGGEFEVAEDAAPNVALGFAEMIGWFPPG